MKLNIFQGMGRIIQMLEVGLAGQAIPILTCYLHHCPVFFSAHEGTVGDPLLRVLVRASEPDVTKEEFKGHSPATLRTQSIGHDSLVCTAGTRIFGKNVGRIK